MEKIKIVGLPILSGEIGLEPKEHPIWLYKAYDPKTNRYVQVIVDTPERPDPETEEKIYKHIITAFKRAEDESTITI